MNIPITRIGRGLVILTILASGMLVGCGGDGASQSPAPPQAAGPPPPKPDPAKAKMKHGPAGPGSDSAQDSALTGS